MRRVVKLVLGGQARVGGRQEEWENLKNEARERARITFVMQRENAANEAREAAQRHRRGLRCAG